MAAETQTPIEALRKAVYRYHDLSHASAGKAFPEHCLMDPCADARAALEDVEALVVDAERVRYLLDEGEEQMKTAAWTIAWNDAVAALRTALAKFTVKS